MTKLEDAAEEYLALRGFAKPTCGCAACNAVYRKYFDMFSGGCKWLAAELRKRSKYFNYAPEEELFVGERVDYVELGDIAELVGEGE